MTDPMRSLVGFLAFIAVLIAVVTSIAIPVLVTPMVVTTVRDTSPFEQPIDVQADVDAIGLMRGFVGEIRISGKDLTDGDVGVGALELTVRGAGIGDHSFADVSGGLDGVTLSLPTGQPLRVERVELSGSSDAVTATVRLDYDATVAFLQWSFDDVGIVVSDIELVDGGLSLVIFDQTVTLAVAVSDGTLVVPDVLGAGPMDLLLPQPDDPWRLAAVQVTPDGMELQAQVDAARVLANG